MCNLHAYIYTSQAINDHLPRQRQLGAEVRDEAEGLLKMQVNKKPLQQHLTESLIPALHSRLIVLEQGTVCTKYTNTHMGIRM